MTSANTLGNLARLVELRQREVDRRLTEIANKQGLRERYQRNLNQLEILWRGAAPTSQLTPSCALNHAHYKQSMLQLASTHRDDLALHDADLAVARQALAQASRQREVMEQLLNRERQNQRRVQDLREQKRQDEMASLVWQRRPA